MDPSKIATVNKGITVGKAFEILSKSVTSDTPDGTALHSLVSRNIVREFGKFLDSPRKQLTQKEVAYDGYTSAGVDDRDVVDPPVNPEHCYIPEVDPAWCYVCDRPKNDCGCVENGGTY